MSFARISRTLEAVPDALSIASCTIPIGTEIKNVQLLNGLYFFEALYSGGWKKFRTSEDLPAFTDKGRARREARMHDALVHGRPRLAPVTRNFGVKCSSEQRDWLEEKARETGKKISDIVRAALISSGMPE